MTGLAASCFLALAAVLILAPTASARDSTITITLTLRGPVSPDLAFELVTDPGVGGSNVFCVGRSWQDPTFPVCRSGTTYRTSVVLGPGESIGYQIHWVLPQRPGPVLWSGTLTGDGRDHQFTYEFIFGLPATDTMASGASGPDSASDSQTSRSAAGVIAAMAASLVAWSCVRRIRRSVVVGR